MVVLDGIRQQLLGELRGRQLLGKGEQANENGDKMGLVQTVLVRLAWGGFRAGRRWTAKVRRRLAVAKCPGWAIGSLLPMGPRIVTVPSI